MTAASPRGMTLPCGAGGLSASRKMTEFSHSRFTAPRPGLGRNLWAVWRRAKRFRVAPDIPAPFERFLAAANRIAPPLGARRAPCLLRLQRSFSDFLAALIDHCGKTQRQIAHECGYPNPSFSHLRERPYQAACPKGSRSGAHPGCRSRDAHEKGFARIRSEDLDGRRGAARRYSRRERSRVDGPCAGLLRGRRSEANRGAEGKGALHFGRRRTILAKGAGVQHLSTSESSLIRPANRPMRTVYSSAPQ